MYYTYSHTTYIYTHTCNMHTCMRIYFKYIFKHIDIIFSLVKIILITEGGVVRCGEEEPDVEVKQ